MQTEWAAVTMAKYGWSIDGERRAHSRVPLRVPALLDSTAAYDSGRCVDVSAGGLCVIVHEKFEPGTRVDVYFELPTGIAIEAEAEVVRKEGRSVALRFVGLDAKTRSALIAFCELSGVRRIILEQPAPS